MNQYFAKRMIDSVITKGFWNFEKTQLYYLITLSEQHRMRLGLSQEKYIELLDISKSTYHRINTSFRLIFYMDKFFTNINMLVIYKFINVLFYNKKFSEVTFQLIKERYYMVLPTLYMFLMPILDKEESFTLFNTYYNFKDFQQDQNIYKVDFSVLDTSDLDTILPKLIEKIDLFKDRIKFE